MTLPRSCSICHHVHPPGQRCKVAEQRRRQRQGTSTQRYGPGWTAISKAVLERDNRICHWCGGRATTADHVTPRSKGGTNDMTNLVASCQPCNTKRGNRT